MRSLLRMTLALLLPGALSLAACSYQGPPLAGYPGLQTKVMYYYDDHAWEEGATCLTPRMRAITRTDVIEDTAEQLVLKVRYRYEDENFGNLDNKGGIGIFNPLKCTGWAERTFVIAKGTGGRLDVVKMSGPQRGR